VSSLQANQSNNTESQIDNQTTTRAGGIDTSHTTRFTVLLQQWFLTFANMPNPYVVFQVFVKPHFAQYNRK